MVECNGKSCQLTLQWSDPQLPFVFLSVSTFQTVVLAVAIHERAILIGAKEASRTMGVFAPPGGVSLCPEKKIFKSINLHVCFLLRERLLLFEIARRSKICVSEV